MVYATSRTRRSIICASGRSILLGTVALAAVLSSAHGGTVSFGGGTITGPGNPIYSVDSSNNIVLAPGGAFVIDGVTAGNISVAYSSYPTMHESSVSLVVHGSNLGQITNGAASFLDTTGGSPNTLGGISLGVNTYNVGSGNITIQTGADIITSSGDAVTGGIYGHYGTGSVRIDSIGATITSANGNGISAGSYFQGNTDIIIGGQNGGIASTIIAPNGWGIETFSTSTLAYVWPGSVTLAASGLIMAKGGILAANVFTLGTIIATSDLAIAGTNVALGAGSITEGGIYAQTLTINSGAIWVTGTTQSLAGIATSDGRLVFNQSSETTFAGTIMAATGLEQRGSGKLILTGGYSGPTTIASGSTLQAGNGGSGGGLYGDIADNGTLIFNTSDTWDLPAVISGAGSVQQIGGGTVILSGTNTYSGGTTISAGTLVLAGANTATNGSFTVLSGGTLQIGNGGTSGSVSGDMSIAGTLAFRHSDDIIYGGAVSGTGGLQQLGPGKLILTGTNTFTGTTTISWGELQIGNGGTSGSIASTSVIDNAGLTFNRSDSLSYAGAISGTGWVQQNGAGTLTLTGANTYAGGTVIASGSKLQLGNGGTTGSITGVITNNGTLVFNRSDTYAFNGTILGGSVVMAGTGSLVFNTPSSFSNLTISGGRVLVGDASHASAVVTGAVTVAANGTLGGHGMIAGAVSNNGIVAPGSSIGTLTVSSYSQSASGTLAIEVAGSSVDLLSVNGAAALDGTLAINVLSGVTGNRAFTFLRATSISGTFATVVPAGVISDQAVGVVYSPTTATVTVEPIAPSSLFSDFNRASFDQLAALSDETIAHYTSTACDNTSNCAELSYWRQAIGGAGSYGDGALQYSRRYAGAMAGVDYRPDTDSWVGLSAAYVFSGLNQPQSVGRVQTHTFSVGINAGTSLWAGRLFMDVLFAQNSGQGKRATTDANGAAVTAVSHPQNQVFGATAGYDRPILFEDIRGFVSLSYAAVHQQAFAESGAAPFDFAVPSQTHSSVYGDLSVRYSPVFTLTSGALVVPEVTSGLRGIVAGRQQDVTAGLADAIGSHFTAPGIRQPGIAFIGGLGVSVERAGTYAIYMKMRGRAGDNVREGIVSIGGVLKF